jgi:putative NADPH-quinone reductase
LHESRSTREVSPKKQTLRDHKNKDAKKKKKGRKKKKKKKKLLVVTIGGSASAQARRTENSKAMSSKSKFSRALNFVFCFVRVLLVFCSSDLDPKAVAV